VKKSSDFDEILHTAADIKLDERHVVKNEKVALDRCRVRQNVFLVMVHNTVAQRQFCEYSPSSKPSSRQMSPGGGKEEVFEVLSEAGKA